MRRRLTWTFSFDAYAWALGALIELRLTRRVMRGLLLSSFVEEGVGAITAHHPDELRAAREEVHEILAHPPPESEESIARLLERRRTDAGKHRKLSRAGAIPAPAPPPPPKRHAGHKPRRDH